MGQQLKGTSLSVVDFDLTILTGLKSFYGRHYLVIMLTARIFLLTIFNSFNLDFYILKGRQYVIWTIVLYRVVNT